MFLVVTRGGLGSGEGSGSGSGLEPLGDLMREFILSEITCNIMEQTPVIFNLIKEGITKLIDEHLNAFYTEMVAMVGACSFTF